MVEFALRRAAGGARRLCGAGVSRSHRVRGGRSRCSTRRARDLRDRSRRRAAERRPGHRHLSPCGEHDHPGVDAHRLAREARGDRAADARCHRAVVRLRPVASRTTSASIGTMYRKPGVFSRSWPSSSRSFRRSDRSSRWPSSRSTPMPSGLFDESARTARERYRGLLQQVRAGALSLNDTDFDTGRPSMFGQNALADETNADLLHELAKRKFAGASPELRKHLQDFFAGPVAAHGRLRRRISPGSTASLRPSIANDRRAGITARAARRRRRRSSTCRLRA